MKKSQIKLVLVEALEKFIGYDYHAKKVFESRNYHEFIVYNRNSVYFYIKWHKTAEYFCDMISIFMSGVNPIDAEKVSKATEYARKLIKNANS